jgi:hypothetical protein
MDAGVKRSRVNVSRYSPTREAVFTETQLDEAAVEQAEHGNPLPYSCTFGDI